MPERSLGDMLRAALAERDERERQARREYHQWIERDYAEGFHYDPIQAYEYCVSDINHEEGRNEMPVNNNPRRRILYREKRNYATEAEAQAAADEADNIHYNWTNYGCYPNAEEAQPHLEEVRARHGRDYWFILTQEYLEYDFERREYARDDVKFFNHSADSFHCAILTDKNMVSFYESPEKGRINRRTEMRIGRYLRRFITQDDNKVSEIAARYGAELGDAVLKFTETREEARKVYMDGPNSCMSGEIKVGNPAVHPAEIYTGPDLAVAYLERDGEITARTVVNKQTRTWLRMYGDQTRLQVMLEKEGYKYDEWTLCGARFLKIYGDEDKSTFVMPYIDGVEQRVILNKDEDNPYLQFAEPPREIPVHGSGCYRLDGR